MNREGRKKPANRWLIVTWRLQAPGRAVSFAAKHLLSPSPEGRVWVGVTLNEMGHKKKTAVAVFFLWPQQDLNLRPTDYESAALTAELWGQESSLHASCFTYALSSNLRP